MADEAKKMQEQKDDTAGLGTLVGITALAALPFLKPIRSFVRQKLAKETIESQAGTKIPRVIAEEAQVVPQIGYTPDKTKVNYMVKQKQPQIEPLLNDRPFESKPMFGSSLYDAIKTSPADEMLADDWLKFFKSKQNVKYNKIVMNSMSGGTIEEQEDNIEKIVKNVTKAVTIDKYSLK